ncbi:Serine carboxypeptidase-like 51 [Dichanthelium oligosanthes]|uniref:Carboxypeptidase n=1 Tax=Dichanthelium oligosanthes TaxID=888268 RepID=A0A1E5WN07_9POAL|nr:Serine carboxypeptidase-like 51 [Dichanthelium oligosanthes]
METRAAVALVFLFLLHRPGTADISAGTPDGNERSAPTPPFLSSDPRRLTPPPCRRPPRRGVPPQYNWALVHAAGLAAASAPAVPLAIAFALFPRPFLLGARRRQLGFLLRGLRRLAADTRSRGIPFFLLEGGPAEVPALVRRLGASALVADFSPLQEALDAVVGELRRDAADMAVHQGGSGVGHGNFLEIGPLDVNMKPRQWTWLKIADLLFVDAPVGVGYSYTEDPSALVTTDSQAVKDLSVILEALLKDEIPTLGNGPLYIVGESYGGKLAAMLGVSVAKAIRMGTLNINLGGVLSYAQLLHYVSRLNDNAVADVNKMGVMVKEQMLAGQYATARQTFTDQLDLIDSQSDSVSMDNFLLDTGMNPVLTDRNLKENSSSQRSTQESGLAPNNTIDGDMNGLIKKKFKLIPKDLIWEEASIDVYNALVNDFMKPAIDQASPQMDPPYWMNV